MILADELARTLAVGVDDLVDVGPAGFAPGAPGAGDELVADLRAAWLEAAERDGARVGVRAEAELRLGDWTVTVSGRADAVRSTPNGVAVERLRALPDGDPEHGEARAFERAGFAALLLELGGETVARVAVVELAADAAPRRRPVAFGREAWGRLLVERVEELARRAELELGRARARRALEPRFPFPEPRPVQQEMLREVAGAAAAGLVLLCSAPTGVGKTAAALFPFLSAALREDRRVFFTTSRTSQQELALDTLRQILPAGGGALALQISAKERVCPQPELGCVERRCPWTRRFAERLARAGLVDELARRGVVASDEVAAAARAHELCPFEVGLHLARRASAVVCDLNYVFDPRVALRHLLEEAAGRDLLIVDEAHDLPERARSALSPALEPAALEALGAALERRVEPAYGTAGRLLCEVAAHCRAQARRLGEEREGPGPWVEAVARGFWEPIALRAAVAQMETQAAADRGAPRDGPLAPRREGPARDFGSRSDLKGRLRDPVQSALADVREFAQRAGDDPERFAGLWSPERAALHCLDPAPWLGARIRSFHAALLMSATLAPLEHQARLCGVDGPRALALDLPCPFPRANRLLVAVDSVDTRFKLRGEHAEAIARTIARSLATRRGNWLAFFPSFAFRDEVVAKLPPGEHRVLLQVPGAPVEPILARLRQNQRETLLVCGVHGGVLAEGVDYPGEMAIGVFVVGPGLPKVELERELVRERFERELGAGFEYAYLVPGLARAVQAGGRVLRGPDDVAAIVLLDRRFAEPEYFDRLPGWWRDELVRASDPVPLLEEFWRGGQRPPGLRTSGA